MLCELTTTTFRHAVTRQRPLARLIHHSDRGSQYAIRIAEKQGHRGEAHPGLLLQCRQHGVNRRRGLKRGIDLGSWSESRGHCAIEIEIEACDVSNTLLAPEAHRLNDISAKQRLRNGRWSGLALSFTALVFNGLFQHMKLSAPIFVITIHESIWRTVIAFCAIFVVSNAKGVHSIFR